MADRDLNDARYADARTASTTGAAGADTDLRRLSELDDFEVADGYPDIRGWKVRTPDGQVLGKVDDLVVSVREMRVRYMDVDVDRSVQSGVADAVTPRGAEAGHALVPIGTATLQDDGDDVIVNSLSGTDLASYPTYSRGAGITREYEQSLRGRFGTTDTTAATTAATTSAATGGASDFYENEYYDESRLFESRGNRSGASEATGASSGGVSGSSAGASGSTRDASVGIPTSREGAGSSGSSASGSGASASGGTSGASGYGASNRQFIVPRSGSAGTSASGSSASGSSASGSSASGSTSGMSSGAADRATNSGFADRVTDKLDDLKDRVDGNPASRPGPDSTDSRI